MSDDHVKQVSLHGRRAYISTEDKLVSESAFVAGGENSVGNRGGSVVVPGSPDVVAYFNDFLGDTGYLQGFTRVNGDTDTGATSTVVKTTMVGGAVRLSWQGTQVATAPTAVTGLTNHLMKNWKPNQGNLRLSARVKLPALASVNAFVGFSDSGGAEMPAYDTGGGVITNMADGVGFLYGNLGSSSTNWQLVSARSVATDSGDPTPVTGSAPTANVYDVLELVMASDSGEWADFYQNGVKKGRISQPVNAATALTPGIWIFGSDTGTIQIDVDYLAISANRDTGT